MKQGKVFAQISGAWIGNKTTDDSHTPPHFYKENWSVMVPTEDNSTYHGTGESFNSIKDALHSLAVELCKPRMASKHTILVEFPNARGRNTQDWYIIEF